MMPSLFGDVGEIDVLPGRRKPGSIRCHLLQIHHSYGLAAMCRLTQMTACQVEVLFILSHMQPDV